MMTGGFHRIEDNHKSRIDVLASLRLDNGSSVELRSISGGNILNNFGAFTLENANNIFTALPAAPKSVAWASITAVTMGIAVFPTDDDTAKVSFQHIKVTAIGDAGPPGIILVDQPYEGGHLIVTNANDETGRQLTFPVRRSVPASVPQFSDADLGARAKSAELLAHLLAHEQFYSRVIALSQDPFERASALDKMLFSNSSTALGYLENRPLEVVGDYLAFPCTDPAWNKAVMAKFDPNPDAQSEAAIAPNAPDERLVTLPTRGVFAEAKLGHCNASEEIDNTRFWDWQQSPIPHLAPEIAATHPVTPQPTSPAGLQPTPFPQSLVNIVNPPAAPDPTGTRCRPKRLGDTQHFSRHVRSGPSGGPSETVIGQFDQYRRGFEGSPRIAREIICWRIIWGFRGRGSNRRWDSRGGSRRTKPTVRHEP